MPLFGNLQATLVRKCSVVYAIGIFLARVIAPHEYGLLATIAIFTALSSSVIDGGMSTALVREKNANTLFLQHRFCF
jgi:O-antigen/teichoic acid export membrane protein